MNNTVFRLMALEYKIKSIFVSPQKTLAEIDIREGYKIIDYGCGPGRYTIPLAQMIGDNGLLYAIDLHPLALKMVNKAAKRKNLKNIVTIYPTDVRLIQEGSIDVAVLYDTLHDISNKDGVLETIGRLLKKGGFLSFKDHHMKASEIESLVLSTTSLVLGERKKKTLSFIKT